MTIKEFILLSPTMSNVLLLVHVVLSTHSREMTIGTEHSEKAYRYITGIVKNHKSKLVAINGIPNHIHLLIDLNPAIALSNLVREIKRSSSLWMKGCGLFPIFRGWSEGYFAGSISFNHKDNVIDYIMGQREHHAIMRFDDEFDRLILKNGMVLYKYPDVDCCSNNDN